MAYDEIISLGATCTPTWQIRVFMGKETLYPFDWILTPFNSLIEIIRNDFADFADADSFHLTSDKTSVFNTRYNVLHHHDFQRERDKTIKATWRDKLALMPRKYEIMIERWRNALDGQRSILFIRHQGHFETEKWQCNADLSLDEMSALCSLLENKYPRLAFDVLFVRASRHKPNHPRAQTAYVSFRPDNPEEVWKGATDEWQRALTVANERAPTPAKWR